MTPIAFFPGHGADSIQPIGKTFVGGLAVSTLVTLFLIPVMYSLLNGWRDKKKAEEEARLAIERTAETPSDDDMELIWDKFN